MKKKVLMLGLCGAAFGILLVATSALAQPGSGGPTPTTVPLDGGASLLLASGVALSLKKLRDHRKRRNQQPPR